MKVIQMPPVHAANLVANIGNTAFGVDVIVGRLVVVSQVIIWTNADFLSFLAIGMNSSEIVIKIKQFSFEKMNRKILAVKMAAILCH